MNAAITKKLVTGGAVLLLIAFIAGGVIWFDSHDTAQQQAARKTEVHKELMSMAASVKTKQSYSQLSDAERPAFLEKQAAAYAFDPRVQETTPDTLRAACVEKSAEELQGVTTRMHNELSAEDFQGYVSIFEHARMTMRANCYANYDPTGKEDIPPVMVHP